MNETRDSLKFDYAAPRHLPTAIAPKPLPDQRLFVNIREAAELLGFSKEALRARLKRGQVPAGVAFRVGLRSIRFDRERLIAWARSQPLYDVEPTSKRR